MNRTTLLLLCLLLTGCADCTTSSGLKYAHNRAHDELVDAVERKDTFAVRVWQEQLNRIDSTIVATSR